MTPAISTARWPTASPQSSASTSLTYEAPTKPSQFALLDHFGPEVRLCNVRLEELLRVEIYRRGLHSDAFCKDNLRPRRNVLDLHLSPVRSSSHAAAQAAQPGAEKWIDRAIDFLPESVSRYRPGGRSWWWTSFAPPPPRSPRQPPAGAVFRRPTVEAALLVARRLENPLARRRIRRHVPAGVRNGQQPGTIGRPLRYAPAFGAGVVFRHQGDSRRDWV